jgi:hypothetical protein
MKILRAILRSGFYGSERYCVDLAVAQARAEHDVLALITDANSDRARKFRRKLSALNPVHRAKIRLSVTGVRNARALCDGSHAPGGWIEMRNARCRV